MGNGTYGIRKPANISSEEVEIFYHYRPTRGSEAAGFSEFKKLDASEVFSPAKYETNHRLVGLYNLRLPLEQFGEKGIYTVYIRPREIEAAIFDVSTLTGNYTNVRGIVFNTSANGFTGSMADNGGLVGYRIDYVDGDGDKTGEYRIITSSNKCEPISQNTAGSTMEKSVRYRFNDNSNLVFCTVTPSTAPSFKPSSLPNLGRTSDTVILSNTNFNPVVLEIEMVNHDADTISTMLEGSQIRNLDNGIITTFDEEGNIYHQATYGNITTADGLHSDFKIAYTNGRIQSQEDKIDEITKQVINGQ